MKTNVTILMLCVFTTLCFSQNILPVSMDIMREFQSQSQTGEINSYMDQIVSGRELTEDQRYDIELEVQFFFESEQFIETGAQYLTALFSERELEEILMVLQDSSLANDPNFQGAAKLKRLMNKLKPYIIQYLRNRTG